MPKSRLTTNLTPGTSKSRLTTNPNSGTSKSRSTANPTPDFILQAHQLRKTFGETEAMRGISLDIQRGEVVAIMGPSGSGKSTLLHCLAGIIRPDHGTVTYFEQPADPDAQSRPADRHAQPDVRPTHHSSASATPLRIDQLSDAERTKLRRHQFGFVFQFSQLVPELTALDNVAIPLLLSGHSRAVAYDQAEHWLDRMGVHAKRHQLATKLSGGQIQRVAVARALAIEPQILFADEPTGSLDSLNSEKVMELFLHAARANGTTVIIVTHEPTIAAYADREIIVRDGQIAPDHLAANGPRPASASRPTVNQLASRLNSQEAHHER